MKMNILNGESMRIMISHVFGYANKGDWALFDALLTILKETFPKSQYYGICRDPSSQRKYFPEVEWFKQLGASYKNGLFRRVENISGLTRGILQSTFLFKGNEFTKRSLPHCFHNVDLVVACPGGYLEDSNVSIITNLTHLWMGLRSEAPVVLAPQSIGPFRKRAWLKLTSSLLSRCHSICVREELSRSIVIDQLKVSPNIVHLLPDMAFYKTPMDLEKAQQELDKLGITRSEPFACVTLIDWYFPFSQNVSTARARYVQEMAGMIKLLKRELGFRTIILKQVERTGGLKGDDAIIAEVAHTTGSNAIPTGKDLSPSVMRGIIKRSSVFIGSRMHSAIFALQVGTPTVAISYLPKTIGIMRMLDLNDFVCNIETISARDILTKIKQSLSSENRFNLAYSRVSTLGESGRRQFQAILRAAK